MCFKSSPASPTSARGDAAARSASLPALLSREEEEEVLGCDWRRPRPRAATIVATPMSSAELSERFRWPLFPFPRGLPDEVPPPLLCPLTLIAREPRCGLLIGAIE